MRPGFRHCLASSTASGRAAAPIASFFKPGEQLYCAGWSGAAPAGWRIEAETTMFRMMWKAPMPDEDEACDALRLGTAHADRALELATLTRPGPLGIRSVELGEYFGCFDGPRLLAMAGERLFTGALPRSAGCVPMRISRIAASRGA